MTFFLCPGYVANGSSILFAESRKFQGAVKKTHRHGISPPADAAFPLPPPPLQWAIRSRV
jgi:hypothetical protein